MISFSYLNQTFPGDTELVDQIVDIYISEFPMFNVEFKNSVRSKDFETMKELVHKWQYTVQVLGLEEIYQDMIRLQEYSHLSDLEIDEITTRVARGVEENYIELLAFRAAS